MKKRALIFTITLCFIFCLSVLFSGKYMAADPYVRNVQLTVDDEFIANLVWGEPVHDLSGVHLKFEYQEWSSYSYITWSSDYPGYTLRVEPEIFDESHHIFSFYPEGDPDFDAELDESGKNKIDVFPDGVITLVITDDKDQAISRDFCIKSAQNIQPPTMKGYKFLGYFEEKTGGTQIFDGEGKKVNNTSETRLFSHWEKTYDITTENTDCGYDGLPKTINPVEVKDPSGNNVTVEYSINGENYSTDISEVCKDCINIGTYKVDYRYKTSETEYQNGTVTLNIHGSKKSMFMGVSSISGFDSKLINYDYLWLGQHEYGDGSSNNSPIKFRVLDNQTNDDYNKAGLFLLSEYILRSDIIDNKNLHYYSYYTSDLRNKLYDFDAKDSQGNYINVFRNSFNDLERGQFLKTTSLFNTPQDLSKKYPGLQRPYVKGENMFLLSTLDLLNKEYFSSNSVFKNTLNATGATNEYFTSSKFLDRVSNIFNYVNSEGSLLKEDKDYKFCYEYCGARPAMNLKVEDVAFSATTAAKDAKDGSLIPGAKATAVGSMLKKVEEDTKNVFDSFKLTLFDKEHLQMQADIPKEGYYEEDNIKGATTIEITGVKPQNTNGLKDNDFVSAIITKKSGEIMYYGRLDTATNVIVNGNKVNLTIPYHELPNNQGADTIENGDYDIKLFLEEYNGGENDANKTDTCSDFVTIELRVRSAIDFVENNVVVTYAGVGQTINSPSYNIDPTYVDVQYREVQDDGETPITDWSFDKTLKTNVRYKGVLPDGSPDPESEVLSYKMQVKVSVKDIYKDHPLLKYYVDGIKTVDFKITPKEMEFSSQGVNQNYSGITNRIEVTPYINGENYNIEYSTDAGKTWDSTNPEFTNVDDTATIDENGNIISNGKTVYFKIIACNYEVAKGSTTATITQTPMQMDFRSQKVTYDGAPHSFDILNYFPSTDKLKITYTYKDEQGNIVTTSEKPVFTEAGVYDVKIDLEENDGLHNYISRKSSEVQVIIDKALINYQAEDTEIEYDGDPHTINLFLSYPTISNAKVEYWSNVDSKHTEEKPEFTDAGEYTVYFKITSKNYKDIENSKKVTIKKSTIICYESQPLDVLYDGGQHAASVYVSRPTADKATVLYSNDNGATYTEKEPPRHRDVGVYKQYFRVEAGKNYEPYEGSKTLTISPRSIKKAVVETISHRAYTGRPITPSIIITDGTPSIINESDYVVSYSNNVDKGEATATITGINNYNDQVTETFYITDSDGETPDDTSNSGTGASAVNESSSGGSGDLTGLAGSASSLLTGEDIRPLFILIIAFILSACAMLIIYRYKNIKHKKQAGD